MHKATYIDFFFPIFYFFRWLNSAQPHQPHIPLLLRLALRVVPQKTQHQMEMGTEGWEFLGKTLTFSVRFSSRPNFPVFLERKDFTLGEKAGISFLRSLKGFFFFNFKVNPVFSEGSR